MTTPAQPSDATNTTTVAPRLVRAVAEATQPYGPFLQGQALQTLEEYMAEPTKTQAVYQALLSRASAEPISLAVVAKCVDVLKRYIPRYAASTEVLRQVDRFCQTTATNLGNSYSGLQKSVLYLNTLAANALDSRLAGSTVDRQTHARGISEPALLVKRGSSSSLGREEFHRANSEGAEQMLSLLPNSARSQASRPSQHSLAESPLASAFSSQREGSKEQGEASSGSDRMRCDALHWRWAPSTPEELSAAVAAGIISEGQGKLSHFRLSVPPDPEESLSLSSAHAHAIELEMSIIRQAQRQQVHQASHPGPESLRPKLRDNRPRLLFQHLPYCQQQKLQLSDKEVGIVVEGVLGIADGQSFWGGKDLLGSREGSSRGSKQGEQAGRACASILIKLLLDLWTVNDAALSFPLALMLLTGGLESSNPTIRARVFDVVYNLAVHAELLYPSQPYDLQMQAADGRIENPAEKADMRSEGGSAADDSSAAANKHRFKQWLLLLLYQLLLLITKAEEGSEAVWNAALGALLHMTVEDGKPNRVLLQPLPPRVLSVLLRCCQTFHWSEQTQCQLIRMTVDVLYSPVASSAAAADPAGDVEPALVLKDERLEDFGGIEEVIRHFKRAPSREAARNLLSILLDYVSAKHIKDGVESGEDTAESGLLENLRLIGYALEAGSMAELLQGAFQCAWPGFSSEFAKALSQGAEAAAGEGGRRGSKKGSYAALVTSILGRLESLACDCAVSVPPEELLPAVQHTLDCVQGDPEEPSGQRADESELSDAWSTLSEYFCSADEWEAALGASWLLSLLLTAAERHLSSGAHQSGSFKRGSVALFPMLPDPAKSPKGPLGIQNQPHISALLRHVLAEAPLERKAASRIVESLARLLQYIKFKCGSSKPSAPSSPEHAGSIELGLNASPAVPSYLLSDEENTPRPRGNGAASDLVERGELEWGEYAEPWIHANPIDMMLPTLFLAVEWLLEAPADRRGDACLEAAELLLNVVTAQGSYGPPFQKAPSRDAAAAAVPADWILEEYAQTSAPHEIDAEGLASATQTCSVVTAFLLGAVAVPRDVLLKVSPVLLTRLFQQLGTGKLPSHPDAQGVQSAIWARDVRAALLLLLIARCSLDTIALQQAGGEGMFVDLLSDNDPRIRFHASTFLQQRLRTARPEVYRRALRHLMQQAQQHDDNKLLRSAHLQLSAMLDLRLVDFSV